MELPPKRPHVHSSDIVSYLKLLQIVDWMTTVVEFSLLSDCDEIYIFIGKTA